MINYSMKNKVLTMLNKDFKKFWISKNTREEYGIPEYIYIWK